MTEDYTYHGPMLTGRHPHIGPMPADATVLQPEDMAALRASLAALEAALVEAEAERAQLVARADLWKRAAKRWRGRARRWSAQHEHYIVCADAERRQLTTRAESFEAERVRLVARAEAAERDASDVRKWADAVPVDAISTVVCAAEPILNDARHRNALDAIRHWATQPEV